MFGEAPKVNEKMVRKDEGGMKKALAGEVATPSHEPMTSMSNGGIGPGDTSMKCAVNYLKKGG